jgi:xylan 1,4-beta-xylosidase
VARKEAASRSDAVVDWEARGQQRAIDSRQALLPAPAGLCATDGAGIVTLTWMAVEGAAGYLVKRGPSEGGPFATVDHQGGDVLAVPDPV